MNKCGVEKCGTRIFQMRNGNAGFGIRGAEFEGLRFDVSGVDHCSERPVDEFRILHSAFLKIPHF